MCVCLYLKSLFIKEKMVERGLHNYIMAKKVYNYVLGRIIIMHSLYKYLAFTWLCLLFSVVHIPN